MAFIDKELTTDPEAGFTSRGLGLAVIFTATIFLSATLLFSVQPMFTKLILPLLGGSSNVWNTAMVFFQAMLLGGYIYAHLVSKHLPFKAQIGVHLLVTALGLMFLPLAIGEGVTTPESGMPTFWLLGLFTVTVGAPFFALSANAPLLQRWFSLTDHKDAQDPYFLYAASNAGSLIILCAYPILIEPNLRLGEQTSRWAFGYMGLIAMLAATGFVAWRRIVPLPARAERSVAKGIPSKPLALKTVAFWILLAFIPSSLMLGVTTYMTNNIASSPFLWIMPLALYLLTFVIVFSKNPIVTSRMLGRFIPWIVLIALAVGPFPYATPLMKIGISLTCFFFIALYCHARLVEERPDVSKLTIFYILMSLGGVLGGVFNALIAPVIFDRILEYGLVLVLAAFILPKGQSFNTFDKGAIPAFLIAVLIAVVFVLFIAPRLQIYYVIAAMIASIIIYAGSIRFNLPPAQKLVTLLVLLGTTFWQGSVGIGKIYSDRSFFSTLGVEKSVRNDVETHIFAHGDTVHNYQARSPDLELEPLSYYTRGGSFDLVIQAARTLNPDINVSVIGLGAGALACYEQAGDDWTYFEIDPKVVDMALRPELFSYMSKCAPDADIRIGDARQRMADIPVASQDLIFVDAFSSNSIPAHLVTREALALYRSRLKPGGLIFYHTSNRMLDVTSVVANVATDAGLSSRYIARTTDIPELEAHAMLADGLLVAEEDLLLQLTSREPDWKGWQASSHVGIWTDDYSSIIDTIRAKRAGNSFPIDIEAK